MNVNNIEQTSLPLKYLGRVNHIEQNKCILSARIALFFFFL
jgi:hypothetical protein